MSTIGRNAILSTPNNNAIDIRTEIAFTNMSQMFDTDKYSGKLALCLNLADIISEQVIRTQTCILGMQRPKKRGYYQLGFMSSKGVLNLIALL